MSDMTGDVIIDYDQEYNDMQGVENRTMTPTPEQDPCEQANQQQEARVTAPTEISVRDAMTTAGDNRDTFAAIPAERATAHLAPEEDEQGDGAGRSPPPPPPRRAPKPYDRVREVARIHAAFADRGPLTFKVSFKGQNNKSRAEYVKSTSPEMEGLWAGFCNDERNELSRFMGTQGNANSERALVQFLRERHEQQQADPNYLTRQERKAREKAIEERAEDNRKTNALLQLEVEGQHLKQQWLEGNAQLGQYGNPLGNLGVYRPRK